MGRNSYCTQEGLNRGAWSAQEDRILTDYITAHGEGRWRTLPKKAGLNRCGKSCRLRWLNYLKPDIKRGNISEAEEELIIRMHKLLGNRWSLIAGRLPGRTDNEIKNYWNTILSKKLRLKQPKKKRSSTGRKPRARPKTDRKPRGYRHARTMDTMIPPPSDEKILNNEPESRECEQVNPSVPLDDDLGDIGTGESCDLLDLLKSDSWWFGSEDNVVIDNFYKRNGDDCLLDQAMIDEYLVNPGSFTEASCMDSEIRVK